MYCLVMLDSGNYIYQLCGVLEKMGYVFEVISTPCSIAKNGCGYCMKFPCEYRDLVIEEAQKAGYAIRGLYKMIPSLMKNTYESLM